MHHATVIAAASYTTGAEDSAKASTSYTGLCRWVVVVWGCVCVCVCVCVCLGRGGQQ